MAKVEHRHPFIEHLVRNTQLVDKAVLAALDDKGPIDVNYIDIPKLDLEGPIWLRPTSRDLVQDLHRLGSVTLWQELIQGSGFEASQLVDEGLVAPYVNTSIPLTAYEIMTRSVRGMNTVLPGFGLAAIVGKDVKEYLIDEPLGEGSGIHVPLLKGVRVAGEVLFEDPAESAGEFLGRMRFLFPPVLEADDGSAWDLLVRFDSFTSPERSCPAKGLTYKLLSSYGKALDQDFGDIFNASA